MLTSKRLLMFPHSDVTLDIAFASGAATILHHHAPTQLQFLRASEHWHLCRSGSLLKAVANNVGCYDLCGGLWLRGADVNRIESNAGSEFDEGFGNWTANVLGSPAPEWVETYNMYGDGALKVKLSSVYVVHTRPMSLNATLCC